MDVRRRSSEEGPVVLMKVDPLEFAILSEALQDQYRLLRKAFTVDINEFSDPQYAAHLLAVMRVMIKEME